MSYGCGLALIAAAVVSGLIEPLFAMFRMVPLDPNEGWNAFFGQIALGGGVLYPAPGSLIVNNYPPLSFYIVGAAGRLVGDNIIAGRMIALASMLIVAWNLYRWLCDAGNTRAAWLGAGIFTALAVTYARPYTAINDPQWLAHAVMTTGLVVLWRGQGSTRSLVLGSLLMLTAGWTKHLLIPIPIAATWWLMRRSTRSLGVWLAVSAVLLAASSFLVWWMFGSQFFDSLQSAREYSLHQAFKDSRRALKCFAPVILLSLALLPAARRNERSEFAVVYFVCAALVAVAASGGIGVDINAFFDLMIAASLCAALAAEAVWQRPAPGVLKGIRMGPALTLLLGLYLGAYAATLFPGVLREWRGLDALENDTRAATRLIAAAGHGRAACETPELCYWAKADYTVDFFNYGQRLKVGKQPVVACEAVFDGRTIPLVQVDPPDPHGFESLPAACNDVIRRNYRPVLESSLGVIFEPALPAG